MEMIFKLEKGLVIGNRVLAHHFELLLSDENNRFVVFTGHNGIGKSSLYRKIREYVSLTKKDFYKEFHFLSQDKWALTEQEESRLSLKDYLAMLKLFYGEAIMISVGVQIKNFLSEKQLEQSIYSLSGGEKQFARLIITLSLPGPYYFIDEPFQNLDSEKRDVILRILNQRMIDKKYIYLFDPNSEFWKVQQAQIYFISAAVEADRGKEAERGDDRKKMLIEKRKKE